MVAARGAGLPPVLLCIILLAWDNHSARVQWTFDSLIVLCWLGFAFAARSRVTGSLLAHFAGAIAGGAVARRTSFLQDRLGQQVFAPGVNIVDDPLLPRGLRSSPVDAVDPATWSCPFDRCAVRSMVTGFVWPRSVRFPCALVVIRTPSFGTDPRSMGVVNVNAAVGNELTSMIRLRNWLSRWLWSLATLRMSTVKVAVVTFVPSIVACPDTSLVRPTAVVLWPNRTSFASRITNQGSWARMARRFPGA